MYSGRIGTKCHLSDIRSTRSWASLPIGTDSPAHSGTQDVDFTISGDEQ